MQAHRLEHPSRVDRRSFLKLASAGSIGVVVLAAACAQAQTPAPAPTTAAPTPTSRALPTSAPAPAQPVAATSVPPPTTAPPAKPAALKLEMPAYVQLTSGPKADLQPNEAGLQAGYLIYPKDLVKTVSRPPGAGDEVTALVQTQGAPPTVMDSNVAWQEVNKQLNATMKMQPVSSTDYRARVAVVMAGNDLPDFFYLSHQLAIAGIPQFLQSAYTDLTPFVAGDAIKEYPNLAAFPTNAWKQTVFEGRIYGVPVVRPAFQNVPFINQSQFDAIGASQPKNADDYRRILQELTRPEANQYGIGGLAPSYGLTFDGRAEVPQLAMFKGPNNWAVDANGKFTKDIETEQFRAALGFVRDLYAAGVFYPDPALSPTTSRAQFLGGRIGVITTGWAAYGPLLWDAGIKQNPPVKVRTLRPFSFDGSQPIWHQSQGFNGLTAIKKSSPERVHELLGILNYLAAPFGSQEYHLLNYGIQDVDHAFDDRGNPVLTTLGQADVGVAWSSVVLPMPVLFDPNDPEQVKAAYEDSQAMVPVMIADPSVGLYSGTELSQGSQLSSAFFDGIGEIVVGRSPLSNLDQLLRDWRAAGGDRIRGEFEQSYAASRT